MKLPALLCLVSLMLFINTIAQKPTKDDVAGVMKRSWEQEKGPKKSITIHNIKFGKSEKANLKHQMEGVPEGNMVTHAEIDWTYSKHYDDKTVATRRIMQAWVYKDAMNNWRVKSYRSKEVKE